MFLLRWKKSWSFVSSFIKCCYMTDSRLDETDKMWFGLMECAIQHEDRKDHQCAVHLKQEVHNPVRMFILTPEFL